MQALLKEDATFLAVGERDRQVLDGTEGALVKGFVPCIPCIDESKYVRARLCGCLRLASVIFFTL